MNTISIYNGKISIDEADIDQNSLLNSLKDFNKWKFENLVNEIRQII